MYYVYILQSLSQPEQTYTGYTTDLKQRLTSHNSGSSIYTAHYKPWKVVFYAAFQEKDKAIEFERYLKTHSGRAFAAKRLW